jgi:2-phospho-L-lactate transferase/gluconeogenesis factor (CofD/UPF0052 family)
VRTASPNSSIIRLGKMLVNNDPGPSTTIPLVLHADFDDGTSAVGESKIAIDRKNIEKVYVTDKSGEKAIIIESN